MATQIKPKGNRNSKYIRKDLGQGNFIKEKPKKLGSFSGNVEESQDGNPQRTEFYNKGILEKVITHTGTPKENQVPVTPKQMNDTLTGTNPQIDTSAGTEVKQFQPNFATGNEDIIPLEGMTGTEQANQMVNTLATGATAVPAAAVSKAGQAVPEVVKAVKTGGDIISKLVKGATAQNKARKILEQEQKIITMSKRLGTSRKNAAKIIELSESRSLTETLKHLSKPAKWGIGLATTGMIGNAGMATWISSDNIITGSGITAKLLLSQAQSGNFDPQEMNKNIAELQAIRDSATRFVNISTMLNPLMWPFRKEYMLNARKTQMDLDIIKQMIEQTSSPEAVNAREMKKRSDQTWDIKNKQTLNSQTL